MQWLYILSTINLLTVQYVASIPAGIVTATQASTGVQAAWASPQEETATQLTNKLGTTFTDSLTALDKYLGGAVTRKPWASSYWPAYRDSINFDWEKKNTSPVSKYAKIYKQNATLLEDNVSKLIGIDEFSTHKACQNSNVCQKGETCAIRRGKTVGRCLAAWYGSCNGWSAATLFEDQPKCPVKYNNVTMEVNDLKALITFIYTMNPIKYIVFGTRCNEHNITVDPYGRPAKIECLDVNPSTFHMLLTNYVGKAKKGIIGEVFLGEEIWNHPIDSYTMKRHNTYTLQGAMKTFFNSSNAYVFNKNAKKVAHYTANVRYVVESAATDNTWYSDKAMEVYRKTWNYDYILELDSNNRILGGEFVNQSKTNHFDFIWIPTAKPVVTSMAGGIQFKNVEALMQASINCKKMV